MSAATRSTRRAWRREPREPGHDTPSIHASPAYDRAVRNAGVRHPDRRTAALVVDRDDECVSRRRRSGRLARGRGERRLFSPECRSAAVPLLPRSRAAMTTYADRIAMMPPASFAMVMATGIVSIACQLLGLPAVAAALLAVNIVFYVTLWILTVARAVLYRARLLADLGQHGRAVGFFT